jgi:hypothetical protein
MQPPLATGGGPSPWRPPPHLRAGLTLGRLEVLAWIRLGALLMWSVWLATLASVFFGPELACFDRDPATCDPGPTSTWVLTRARTWTVVLGLACVASVVAWRHRRGTASRRLSVGALAARLLVAVAASRIVWLPPF